MCEAIKRISFRNSEIFFANMFQHLITFRGKWESLGLSVVRQRAEGKNVSNSVNEIVRKDFP